VDHRSDLFALGSLLYEMLSGRPPFRGDNVLDTLSRIAGTEPAPLAELCPDLPRPLIDLVERLLQKDPERRPQSADLVARELAALSSGFEAGAAALGVSPRRPPIPDDDARLS